MILAMAIIVCPEPASAKKKSKKKHSAPASESVDVESAESPGTEGADNGATPGGSGPSNDEESGPSTEKGPDSEPAEATKSIEGPPAEPAPVDETRPGSALEAMVGGAALFRTLAWNQDLTPQLSGYSLSPGPEGRVGLEVFPGAFATGGPASNVGIIGTFGRSVGVNSQAASGAALATTFEDFLFGLKARIPLGSVVPYLSATYGGQSFTIAGQGSTTSVPGTDYRFLRVGLGSRVQLSAVFSLDVGAGYLFVTQLGSGSEEIGSSTFFPRGKAYAVDGDVSVAARITKNIGLRGGVAARQYGLSFNVQKGDPNVVGGAIDRYVVVGGGVEVVLDRSSQSSAAPTEEATPELAPSLKKTKTRWKPEPEPQQECQRNESLGGTKMAAPSTQLPGVGAEAAQHLAAGRLQSADELCLRSLAAMADEPGALLTLGQVLAAQTGWNEPKLSGDMDVPAIRNSLGFPRRSDGCTSICRGCPRP